MLDNTIVVDGLFTYILYTSVIAGEDERPSYKFRTNTLDGTDTCKSSMGCFDELYIDNNLQLVIDTIDKYDNDEDDYTDRETKEEETINKDEQ